MEVQTNEAAPSGATKIPSYYEVKAELCRRSLYYFFCEFWVEINSDELVANWHIKKICDELQIIMEGVIRGDKKNDDFLANVPPGTSKSSIGSQMLLAWLWTMKPDAVGIFSTISTKNADDFSRKFRDIVTSEKYKKYFPYIKLRFDSTALYTIRNDKGGARLQYTTHSRKTGIHGHFILCDDNMAFEDAISDTEAERCNESLKGLLTREKKNAYCPKIFFMQMQSKIDSTQWVIDKFPNIKRIVLPAWNNGRVEPNELTEHYIDGLLNPTHMDLEFLKNKRLQLGDYQYMAEYGQDCEAKDGYLYETINTVPSIEKRGICLAVTDPADDGDCYLATVFARIYDKKVFIVDIVYTQANSDTTIPLNIAKAKQHKPMTYFIENDGMGAIYAKGVKKGYPYVKAFQAKGNKDERIATYSNIVSRYFHFLDDGGSMEYNNAVNSMRTYKKIGKNKYKDIQDAITSLATVIEKNKLIDFYK
jgi:predicted phage terminase large subunit-like protein